MSSKGPHESPKIIKFAPMAEQTFVLPTPGKESGGTVHPRNALAQPFVPQRVTGNQPPKAAPSPPKEPAAPQAEAPPPPPPPAAPDPAPLAAAEAKAQQLVLDARQEAARILADAQAQATKWRQDAYQGGYLEGQESAQAEWEARLKQAADLLNGSIEARHALFTQSEGEVVRLAIEIARKVVHKELELDPQLVAGMAKEALKHLGSRTHIRIHLNPNDIPVLEARMKELTPLAREIELVADDGITPGGCLVEGSSGRVDARIETQIATIEAGLLSVMDAS